MEGTDGNVRLSEENVLRRWKELMNAENEGGGQLVNQKEQRKRVRRKGVRRK